MKLGFLYAGQGSQHPGMGQDFYETFPAFREVFDRLPAEFDLKETCFSDPKGHLDQTQYTQPCMVAFAVGVTAVLKAHGIVPAAAAGLSLGEYSALYAAGVLDETWVMQAVSFRAKAMGEVGQGGAMVAVLGLDRETLQRACTEAAGLGVVVIANDNCPGQLVLGGEREAVMAAVALAKPRRAVPLRVSGAFHTPLMKPAGDALAAYFKNVPFSPPKIPVIFNVTGTTLPGHMTIPQLLVAQVQSGVNMTASIRAMGDLGVDGIVEIGPGRVLSGFVRKTLKHMPVYSIETVEDLSALLAQMKGDGKCNL